MNKADSQRQDGMKRLPASRCRRCGATVESAPFVPEKNGGARTATNFESCLRRCEGCDLGFSNSKSKPELILRDPFAGMPEWVREVHDTVLSEAMNELNRQTKKRRFASMNSEDHVTWIVCRVLQRAGTLGATFSRSAFGHHYRATAPAVLLWGAPVGENNGGPALRARLVQVLDELGEVRSSRSEPDVLLRLANGDVIIVEVKLGSPNDDKPPGFRGWDKYVQGTSVFRNDELLRNSGQYELARNWRIGCELAGRCRFALLNLGPESLFSKDPQRLESFRASLAVAKNRGFATLPWANVLEQLPSDEPWLQRYLRDRRVVF